MPLPRLALDVPPRLVAGVVAGLVATAVTATAGAQIVTPRDYFLDPPRVGTYALLDAYTFGAQANLEKRMHLEEGMSQLVVRANALASVPYGEVGGHVDARVLFLTLGASVNWRGEWRNLTFDRPEERRYEPSELLDMKARKTFEDEGRKGKAGYPWAEARARLALPFEALFVVLEGAYRYEHKPNPGGESAPSFDWWYNTVYERGAFWRGSATFFLRNQHIGAIGPTVRLLGLPRNGTKDTELGFGLVAGTRPGGKRDRDLLLVNFLVSPGDEYFGNHAYPGVVGPNLRFYLFAIYRMELKL